MNLVGWVTISGFWQVPSASQLRVAREQRKLLAGHARNSLVHLHWKLEPMAGIGWLPTSFQNCGSNLSNFSLRSCNKFALIALILRDFLRVSTIISLFSHFLFTPRSVSEKSELVPVLMPVTYDYAVAQVAESSRGFEGVRGSQELAHASVVLGKV
jgi:hypothetical protein